MDHESWQQFESRKADHLQLALSNDMQTLGLSGLERIRLEHRAFPEINLSEVEISSRVFSDRVVARYPYLKSVVSTSPFFVSSMTAGHQGGNHINLTLARICAERGWVLAVGSQRRQLGDAAAAQEWKNLRAQVPNVILLGNLGLAQAIQTPTAEVRRLADSLEASAMIIHTNPLQEVLQPEGTPNFAGGFDALRRLAKDLDIPVIVKEVGCGMSATDFRRLEDTGVSVVDVSGLGGTHWGRIEGARAQAASWQAQAAATFSNWGISTVDSLLTAVSENRSFDVWASGGVRNGLDGAKLVALGAGMVGIAKPALEAALLGEEKLRLLFERFEQEFRVSLFCTGSKTIEAFQRNRVWAQNKI